MPNTVYGDGDRLAGYSVADGTRSKVIAQTMLVDTTGTPITIGGGGTSASPTVTQSQGSSSFATNQATANTGTANQIVAARAGRAAVTITNLTGAQQVFVGNAGVTVATGQLIPATVGASITIPTQAAIFGISATAAQTVTILETF